MIWITELVVMNRASSSIDWLSGSDFVLLSFVSTTRGDGRWLLRNVTAHPRPWLASHMSIARELLTQSYSDGRWPRYCCSPVCATHTARSDIWLRSRKKKKNMIKVTEQNDIATSIRLFIKSLIGCDVIPPGATPWILPCYCIDKQRFVISWWGGGWMLHAKLEVLGICYLRPFQHNCMPSRI